MSVIAHRKSMEIPTSAGQTDRTAITSPLAAVVSFLRKAILRGAKTLAHIAEVSAAVCGHPRQRKPQRAFLIYIIVFIVK